jgi:hypothetical protein
MRLEHKNHVFEVSIVRDEDMREPWKEHDGHGIISDWTRREKKPGERVLCSDRESKRYYDFEETTKLALKDGWGCDTAVLETRLKRKPTKKEVVAESVEQDFRRMQAWCDDEWYWVGVCVTLLKADSDAPSGYFKTKHKHSVWGVESDAGEYLTELARENADEILSTLEN